MYACKNHLFCKREISNTSIFLAKEKAQSKIPALRNYFLFKTSIFCKKRNQIILL